MAESSFKTSPAACRRFVDLYSEYRDDQLDPATRAAVLAHLDRCSACRRYDRVIRTGVSVLRDSERDFDHGLPGRGLAAAAGPD